MANITLKLLDRSIGANASLPLEQLKTILVIPDDKERGVAFSRYFRGVQDIASTVNDIDQLRSIINWSPEGQGILPLEMAKRLSLASKIIGQDYSKNKKEQAIELDASDIDVIKSILNNSQFRVTPNAAFYGFLIHLQEQIGPIYKIEENES